MSTIRVLAKRVIYVLTGRCSEHVPGQPGICRVCNRDHRDPMDYEEV